MRSRSVVSRELLDQVRAFTSKRVQITDLEDRPVGDPVLRCDELLSRVQFLQECAAVAPNVIDGYGPSGRTMAISTPVGVDHVPTSSTERAAFGRLGGAPPDPIVALADEVLPWVRTLREAWENIERIALVELGKLQRDGLVSAPPMCAVAELYGLPFDEVWKPIHMSTLQGLLAGEDFDPDDPSPSWHPPLARGRRRMEGDWKPYRTLLPQPVGAYAYKFVNHHGRLPTREQMVAHLERQRLIAADAASKAEAKPVFVLDSHRYDRPRRRGATAGKR